MTREIEDKVNDLTPREDKDVTFETLNRQDFLDTLQEAFPRVNWEKPHEEFRAAGEKEG